MSYARTPHGYRTDGLWATAGIAFGALTVFLFLAVVAMSDFGERCAHGLIQGPGRLREVRHQAFPPATVCEFQGGEVVSVGGRDVLGTLLWTGLLVMVVCLFVALLAECLDPEPGGRLVTPMSRTRKLRRTGTAFAITGFAFLLLYALAGWRLVQGPSSACSAGRDRDVLAPRTLEYSLFPPQATCQYASGHTKRVNPPWLVSLTAQSAAPTLLAGVGFALAWRRRGAERRDAGRAASPSSGREDTR
ncbi:hypothetical protein [Streptomyces sp. ALB3]|uniref:hypothetical protein n=1 Tax=Streptomyces sp. ALB3 TaxID=3374278 RepID=UPI0037BAEEE8